MRRNSALNNGTADSRRSAVAEEQEFLDSATARRDRLADHLRAELSAEALDAVEQARQRMLRQQYEELRRAREGLVFGRLDGLDGTVRHVGRVGLRNDDEDSEPLLVDWRAPAARPFYTATAVDPQGQARRRHIRTTGSAVVGVDDEPLDGTMTAELVGEGALLAALDQRRTGRMSTAISTLQREQDDIIRAEATGPLIVQGGPGTGKTVVALHRVAYLLFTHRQMADQAVLVLGPSPRFLQYIAQVLPALGETAVVSATCDTLLTNIRVGRDESRSVAEIKGRALWQPALENYVTSLLPRPRDLKLRWEGEFHVISASAVAQALASAVQGRPYQHARTVFAEQLHHLLAEAVVEQRKALMDEMEEGFEDILARVDSSMKQDHHFGSASSGSDVDGLLSEDEISDLRSRIAENATIARFIEAWWHTLDAETLLRRFLTDRTLLAQFAPRLSPEEITAVSAEPAPWASSDIPLLDALADLLGEGEAPQPQGEFVADHARRQRGWVYGHIVIDEAQELSEMQWQMVLRRCPSRSITAVGDIDQAEAAHRHTSWAQAVRAAFGDRWTAAELTICYRTPREVMDLTEPVLKEAGSHNAPPRAVRSAGIAPWELTITPAELADAAAQALRQLQRRWQGGMVGVIAPTDRIAELLPVLNDVPVLSATQSKGLEWDATLLIDPQGIAAEPRGWNGLYVALTRCTQELGQLILTH
ncbi:HelD family protein [Micromonospora parathelypteridis]|uniref:DNA helicase IV n=1 Tax=Micromonospora parathelypteridis TaxID=1839617 RepID=A0A840VUP0_9ACTN|nr:UvrD-helicase domain-containing protein [Micromonospora parathelypteridis]MBB5480952.1 DNA helicase IV [Micromonospora parathelypteridis]GGO20819.1 DNA helicase [Micromonospora parathelypteridis]